MKRIAKSFVCFGWLLLLTPVVSCGQANEPIQEFVGWVTNGPALMRNVRVTTHTVSTQFVRIPARLATNTPPATNAVAARLRTNSWTYTNLVFESYQPGSLPQVIWTNFMARTNGRDLRIWSERSHSDHWPKSPPLVSWNTNSVIWGLKGFTALSPCWEGEGAPGQVPLTALTRRHVYARGHHLGDPGFNPGHNGRKAWFVTADNSIVTTRIINAVVRVGMRTNGPPRDYTIMLLERDLPETIEPVAVASLDDVQKYYMVPAQGFVPRPIFQTEQGGFVNTGVAPLTVNAWKGGDSGSPNMVPLPGELVFFSGRSTSGPSREMQEDMDELCRREGINPAKYQLRWVDWGKYEPK
jgi:hypothetical protein